MRARPSRAPRADATRRGVQGAGRGAGCGAGHGARRAARHLRKDLWEQVRQLRHVLGLLQLLLERVEREGTEREHVHAPARRCERRECGSLAVGGRAWRGALGEWLLMRGGRDAHHFRKSSRPLVLPVRPVGAVIVPLGAPPGGEVDSGLALLTRCCCDGLGACLEAGGALRFAAAGGASTLAVWCPCASRSPCSVRCLI